MGTMIDLRVGNLVVDWGKNEFFSGHWSLFQTLNVQNVEAGRDPGSRDGVIRTLARTLREVVPRLALLGYTLDGAREDNDSVLQVHASQNSRFPSFDTF
jgi:hypothetical protein